MYIVDRSSQQTISSKRPPAPCCRIITPLHQLFTMLCVFVTHACNSSACERQESGNKTNTSSQKLTANSRQHVGRPAMEPGDCRISQGLTEEQSANVRSSIRGPGSCPFRAGQSLIGEVYPTIYIQMTSEKESRHGSRR